MIHRNGFTLIELLVVITIIVVLLALLTPALDKAIYQAELATCGAQLKGVVSETQMYAMDFKRHYPYRINLSNQQTIEITEGGRGWDLRPIVKGYLRINSFTCPLSGKVDVENSKPDTTFVFGSYDYLSDWRYFKDPGYRAMSRIGDRFTSLEDGTNVLRSFSLLASDRDVIGIRDQVGGSHPDRDGVLRQIMLQDAANYEWGLGGGAAPYGSITIAAWVLIGQGSHSRGAIDRNFAYQDGSVMRLGDLIVQPDGQPDDRLVTAPYNSDGSGYAQTSTGADKSYYTAFPRE